MTINDQIAEMKQTVLGIRLRCKSYKQQPVINVSLSLPIGIDTGLLNDGRFGNSNWKTIYYLRLNVIKNLENVKEILRMEPQWSHSSADAALRPRTNLVTN